MSFDREILLLLLFSGLCLSVLLWQWHSRPSKAEYVTQPSVETDTVQRSLDARPAHVDSLLKYHGTIEEGDNMGPEIVRRCLASVGLNPGYPYCSACVSWALEAAGAERPKIRSALASDFLDGWKVIDPQDVRRGSKSVRAGAVGVHVKGNGPYGHNWFTRAKWSGQCGKTIEANTTAPEGTGSQREGNGIWKRERCIFPSAYFSIEGFVQFRYE